MRSAAFLVAFPLMACSGSSGSEKVDWPSTTDGGGNAGSLPQGGSNADANRPGMPASDAGNKSQTPSSDAGAGGGDLGSQVTQYITCKPDELNPVLDCLTNKCPSQSDPVAAVTCLVGDCAALVNNVSPKCRDCVVAAAGQDPLGIAQSCLDTAPLLGDASLPLM